jgi:hypothetical protein
VTTQGMMPSSFLDRAHAFYVGPAKQRWLTYLSIIGAALLYGIVAVFAFGIKEPTAAYQCATVTALLTVGLPLVLGLRARPRRATTTISNRSLGRQMHQRLPPTKRDSGRHRTKQSVIERHSRLFQTGLSRMAVLAGDAALVIMVLVFNAAMAGLLQRGVDAASYRLIDSVLQWSGMILATIFCIEAIFFLATNAFEEIRNRLKSLRHPNLASTAHADHVQLDAPRHCNSTRTS